MWPLPLSQEGERRTEPPDGELPDVVSQPDSTRGCERNPLLFVPGISTFHRRQDEGDVHQLGIRIVAISSVAYLALALLGHGLEQTNRLICECLPECWCKRRGVSLFRWVFPFRHRCGAVTDETEVSAL